MAAAVAPLAAGTAHRGTVCHSPEYLMLSAMRGLHTDLFSTMVCYFAGPLRLQC